MRIWSLHPQYLDAKGLVALWRETLLAQAVLSGKTKGYKNHPQLDRFKAQKNPVAAIGTYQKEVHREAKRRGYNFNLDKIIHPSPTKIKIKVTSKQLEYELERLKQKLKLRAPVQHRQILSIKRPIPHPIFKKIKGPIENWEVVARPVQKTVAE